MVDLCRKYEPKTWAEILGQDEAVEQLRTFAAEPYPAAFLFAGGSGVGKTAGARVLARELGCAVESGELGGLYEIASGEQTAESVRRMLEKLRLRPLLGSGWRVLIVNEADRMNRPAEIVWLDALEHIPPKTVIVFTTNAPEGLSQRFRNRCEEIFFTDDTHDLAPAVQELLERVWYAETGERHCPIPPDDWMPRTDHWNVSFRYALKQAQKYLREWRARHQSLQQKQGAEPC